MDNPRTAAHRAVIDAALHATPDTVDDAAEHVIEVATIGIRNTPSMGQEHTALLMARGAALYVQQSTPDPAQGAAALRAMGWALDSLPYPARA